MVKFNAPSRAAFEASQAAMDRTFAALADPTRRAIVARLADADAADGPPVTDLAAPFLDRMSLPAVSKHLRVLERAGLLTQARDGRVRRCRLRPEPLKAAYDWVARYQAFWGHQLDALTEYLEADAGSAPPSSPPSSPPSAPSSHAPGSPV